MPDKMHFVAIDVQFAVLRCHAHFGLRCDGTKLTECFFNPTGIRRAKPGLCPNEAQEISRSGRRKRIECSDPDAARGPGNACSVDGRQIIKQGRRFGKMAGRARQGGLRTGKRLFERWNQGMAKKITPEVGIAVTFILDPAQLMLRRVGFDRRTRNIEKRPNERRAIGGRAFRRHPGHASDAGATQQVQQNRLGLVVAMMSERQPVRSALTKRRVANAPCGAF